MTNEVFGIGQVWENIFGGDSIFIFFILSFNKVLVMLSRINTPSHLSSCNPELQFGRHTQYPELKFGVT